MTDNTHNDDELPTTLAFDTTNITSPGNVSNPKPGDPSHTLAAGAHPPAVVLSFDSTWSGAYGNSICEDQTPPMKAANGTVPTVAEPGLAVRRLTPVECERLMGWEDFWTATGIDLDGNEVTIADSSRYRMCGNGVASPVATWIGECIIAAHDRLGES